MRSALLRKNIMQRWEQYAEPTLSELLSDPIIKAVMTADGVDPREIEGLMRRVMGHCNEQARGTRDNASDPPVAGHGCDSARSRDPLHRPPRRPLRIYCETFLRLW